MWPRGDSRPDSRQAAVIDVGSNSVRLVIYRLDGRAIWTVYNEKALAGLGRDLPSTGRLSPEGVETALAAIRRFRTLLDGWRAEEVTAAATAAVREAAEREVRKAGISIPIAWLKKSLADSPSEETRTRLERLVEAHTKLPDPAGRRLSRAVQVLELAGTAEAKALLKTWSAAQAGSLPAVEATAALGRLRR